MNLENRVSIPAQVMARDVGGETVILNLESGIYFGLDAVGARIWQLLSEHKTLAEVRDSIVETYDVSSGDAERDLLSLFEQLQSQKLVEIVHPGN
ncbi:MAG: PqqD family protein [Rudaea sp.]